VKKSPSIPFKEGIPPIIIIGMHRSGTTMIAEMLQQLGLFIGKNLDPNSEPEFFIQLNDWLLDQCAGKWDRPIGMDALTNIPQLESLVIDYLKYVLQSLPVRSYIGLKRFLGGKGPKNAQFNWGWKDPRNTFTLPVWLKIFPEAKVLHVYRNGIDVASSLKVRAERELQSAANIHHKFKRMGRYQLGIKRYGFVASARVCDVSEGFKLWEDYVAQGFSYQDILGDRIMHICYEDFLKAPAEQLEKIAHFCGLSPIKTLLGEVAGNAKESRGFAFQQNAELLAYYEQVKSNPWMVKLGYSHV